ncbi:MAG: glycerol-3-phosphate 1-O-acyltransferase PlsY [Clostridia bacterium]|nr:glycerol-3-phosphate 1-O-acyltransferase PlsY [Clostridia bacterium]
MTELFYMGWLGILAADYRINVFWYISAIVVCAILSYLIGSLSFSIIISRKMFGDDIRNHGSSNAGATNMLRTYGKKAAALTFLGDFMKAVVAVLGTRLLCGFDAACVACLFCAIGHAFPCWFKFKGGKCAAVLCASILCIDIWTFLICMTIFTVILLFTKYVSLASIFSAFMGPIVFYNSVKLNSAAGHGSYGVVCVFLACMLLIFLHRENIKRLRNGTESKIGSSKAKQSDEKKEN